MNEIKRVENINYASNQGDNNTHNWLLDVNGHLKAEMLERNKITCSFRKLKSNHLLSNKNSNANFTTSNGLLEENNTSSLKPPFHYSSINNKNQNNFNTNNSNLNKSNLNSYHTRETISRRRTLYQSVNQSILNCSSLAAKIFLTKQEKTAKKIEDGFEKLQKLARNLKIIESNNRNSKLFNIIKYDDLFDILEFKGMEKERDIIDKNVQKKKKRINSEVKKPFTSSRNLNKIYEDNPSVFSEMKKKYNKNNYESHCKIDLNDKEINYNSDSEISTFNKENFLSMATLNSTAKKLQEYELIDSQKNIFKEDYTTNVSKGNDRLKILKKENSQFSRDLDSTGKENTNVLTKLRELERIENDVVSDDKENDTITRNNKPFKLTKNPNTASKGFPPRNANLLTSSKKRDFPPHNLTANKKLKVNEFNQSPTTKSPFKIPNANYNFKEKIELAAKVPFANKRDSQEKNFKINFSDEKNAENRKKDKYKNQSASNKKEAFKNVNSKFSNQYKGANKVYEKNENYDSSPIKLDSQDCDFNNIHKGDEKIKNPFKINNQKLKNTYSSSNKNLHSYSSNYASNNHISNFNSNLREASLISKTNDHINKSNYDTYDMKEMINDNSHITSTSIISCNVDFDSNIRTNNIDIYNGDTNNIKTNDIYGSNSFGDYNSENVYESQFCSNLTNFDQNIDFKSNYKNLKNDFDNYEEYESAMRKMELGIEDIPNKGNGRSKKNLNKNSTNRTNNHRRNSNNSNLNNNATESDYISDYSKNSRLSSNSQINNFSYITKSSVSDTEI